MTITRAQAEAELLSRIGQKMTVTGLDGTTADGSNGDLSGALASAARAVGVSPASPFTVSDSDLDGIGDDTLDEFIDRAELRALQNVAGNIDLTDVQIGPRREALGQLASQVEKAIARIEKRLHAQYGDAIGSIVGGTIARDMQANFDDELSA